MNLPARLLLGAAILAHGSLWGLGFLETGRFEVGQGVAALLTLVGMVARVAALALGLAELGRAWRAAGAEARPLLGWLFGVGLVGAGITSLPLLVAAAEGVAPVAVLPWAWARWVWLGAAEAALLAVFAGLFVGPATAGEQAVQTSAPGEGAPARHRCGCGRTFSRQQGLAAHARHCPRREGGMA